MSSPSITLHKGDLGPGVTFKGSVAIDTETLGLNPNRDRLCLVQLSAGDGSAHLVQPDPSTYDMPRASRRCSPTPSSSRFSTLPSSRSRLVLEKYLGVSVNPVYCTKIVSKLVRTYTDRHGLKDLTAELLGIELSKQQQSSDWAATTLSQQQLAYAAADVLHLHALKAKLDAMLEREGRGAYAKAAFEFLPTRAKLDLAGYGEDDIFAH